MQLFVSLLRTQYPEFAYLWPRVGIFKFSAKIFPSSYQPELKLCVSTKTLPVFFVAKATPPHSLSKPSELQSEEQSSISKSTCERTCSMTYTVSPLIMLLHVTSKLKQITKLAHHLLQIQTFHKPITVNAHLRAALNNSHSSHKSAATLVIFELQSAHSIVLQNWYFNYCSINVLHKCQKLLQVKK